MYKLLKLQLFIAVVAAARITASAAEVTDCLSFRAERSTVRFSCAGTASVLIQAETPSLFRVRISPDGKFPESLTVKWGYVKDDWPAVPLRTHDAGKTVQIETADLRIEVSKQPFQLAVFDRGGRLLLRQAGVSSFEMQPDEHFYGLGFQRKAFDIRGQKLQWWRTFRSAEATVPFFLSTRGYGFYSNNTWRHVFDFTGAAKYTVTSDGGQPDYYVIHGPAFRDILDRYTSLTGRPMLAPRWALGIGYQSRYLEEQAGVLNNAQGFRREDLPLDWIGLEPGWEDVPYAMKWNWSAKRFPDPGRMIQDLAAIGIKMGLWESGEAPKAGFTEEAVRREWYRPRIDAAIRKGIKFFKQDDPYPRMISSQEMLPPQMNSALGGSGVFTAAELNNISNTLYSETAMNEYRRVTGERTMIMFNGYHSSIASHRWPFTWEADFPLGVGALSASLSGHSLVSTRDRNEAPDGIHLGYLAPFCYLESWAYYKEPWLYSEKLLDMNRFYAKLRYRLIPYLYSSARQSVESGLPLMRPMVLEFQNDPDTHNLATQFMMGDSLLVASATANLTSGAELLTSEKAGAATPAGKPKVYLPRGRWYDFWTGSSVESKAEWRPSEWPKVAGGPLWVKGGAIIPMGPVTAYADQEPLEVVRLDVYPSGTSRYILYEDDGRTYDYEKGAYATTEIRSVEKPGGVSVSIGARKGQYAGMPARRGYLVSIHTQRVPITVTAAGRPLPHVPSKEDLTYVASRRGWSYDAASGTLWIKPSAGWRYDYDERGAGKDPDRDTAYWNTDKPAGGQAMDIAISLGGRAASPKPAALFGLNLSHYMLIADGGSTSRVTVTVPGGRTSIRVEAEGPVTLGCGGSVCELKVVDGTARTTVASTLKTGPVRIRATAGGLQPAEATLEVVRGTIVLKASPPERIKLNSDGAWLPLRVTLYASIYARGVRVESAGTKMRMHVTGGAGKTPEDREVEAVDGIAVFPDVFFEKPPKYVMHVSGAGLEPAQIPIYYE